MSTEVLIIPVKENRAFSYCFPIDRSNDYNSKTQCHLSSVLEKHYKQMGTFDYLIAYCFDTETLLKYNRNGVEWESKLPLEGLVRFVENFKDGKAGLLR